MTPKTSQATDWRFRFASLHNAEAIFTWDYEKGRRPALNKLYEKAKHSQWNGETDLDWSIEVDQERAAAGARIRTKAWGRARPVKPESQRALRCSP